MIIESVNISETRQIKSGKNEGKDYWSIGVKIDGVWYNGFTMYEDQLKTCQSWKQGDDVPITTYEEEYTNKEGVKVMGKKFKFPSKLDLLETRVRHLEQFLINPDKKPIVKVAEDKQDHAEDNLGLPF